MNLESEVLKMAYRCLNCGHIFKEGEEGYFYQESDFWGVADREKIKCCPVCHIEDYEELESCKICGSEHFNEEINGGVCDECIEKYHHDLDMCFKVGSNDTEPIQINCFLAFIFEKNEIEKILLDALKDKQKYLKEYVDKDCENFVNNDRSWFAENLIEEVKKNENTKG